MAKGRGRRSEPTPQDDLFSVDPSAHTMQRLEGHAWPDARRFPLNRAGAHVRDTVWDDLAHSHQPLLVAGYSSIDRIVALVAGRRRHVNDGQVRLLLGAEPFPTTRRSFAAPDVAFTEDVRRYWLEERGISLHLSAMVLQAIDELDAGRLTARFVHGQTTLHAKIYVGDDAATVGSSNFTDAGLSAQLEANARFERAGDGARFEELRTIAEHLWSEGQPWDEQLRALLEALLRVVPWQEALARACAELLEGEWAERYLRGLDAAEQRLWPSQRAGIAQALWIAENVGSVLVADATGSGKTRMGAHLVRAVRDRLWSTGRVRRDLTVLVCPPGVETTWQAEAISCGLSINTVSHGLLSRRASGGDDRLEQRGVRSAQILAVDEAHNFLNPDSNRTQQVRESQADHVALFTATPINRGAGDLLRLIALLGADNFEDATLAVLKRLERTRSDIALSTDDVAQLRGEIQRFTVRRTKSALNALVDREPDAYVHPATGRVCRYPRHDSHVYVTGETAGDEDTAEGIRATALDLRGVAQLERHLHVPAALRRDYTDDRWLQLRLASSAGLSTHHVLSAMRSSRAALVEHVLGTAVAAERFGIDPRYKTTDTGNVLAKLDRLADEGPPRWGLACEAPEWLADADAWRAACGEERQRFESIVAAVARLSDARERTKAALLAELGGRHARVLAFDRHLVTLSVLETLLAGSGPVHRVLVATGGDTRGRDQLTRVFDRASTDRAIALCSDAMNEGLNLQGASAIVHLDLPTTLRVAEQRVGRVDRMDSPHDAIEAWWPDDGPAFATNANELLVQRAHESERLLGSNLPVPELRRGGARVDVRERIRETESVEAELWDGIRDALEPVRRLVDGEGALVPRAVYDHHRADTERVAARVSPVRTATAFAFFAVAGNAHGAPRWVFLPSVTGPPIVDLDRVSDALVRHLRHDPEGHPLDDAALALLGTFLDVATRHERLLLPRRMQRALEQMATTTTVWAEAARRAGDEGTAATWLAIGRLASNDVDARPDPYLVAERWLEVVAPVRERYRDEHRHAHYVLLRDLDRSLRADPLDLTTVSEAFSALPLSAPLAERVSACILGVPGEPPVTTPGPPPPGRHGSR